MGDILCIIALATYLLSEQYCFIFIISFDYCLLYHEFEICLFNSELKFRSHMKIFFIRIAPSRYIFSKLDNIIFCSINCSIFNISDINKYSILNCSNFNSSSIFKCSNLNNYSTFNCSNLNNCSIFNFQITTIVQYSIIQISINVQY